MARPVLHLFLPMLLAFPPVAIAAQTPPPAVSAGSLVQMVLALAVVLAAIVIVFWLMRRFLPGQAGAHGAVKIVGGVMVGPRERLVVVEVEDTWLLLGVAAGQVNTLHIMPRPANVAPGPAAPPMGAAFAQWLERARKR